MFGHWATCLCPTKILETPQDFIKTLSAHFPAASFRKLDYVRDWAEYLGHMQLGFEGMGGSVGAAHSYEFLRRN
eukprot:11079957-Karenia_brevis.AAC.1